MLKMVHIKENSYIDGLYSYHFFRFRSKFTLVPFRAQNVLCCLFDTKGFIPGPYSFHSGFEKGRSVHNSKTFHYDQQKFPN